MPETRLPIRTRSRPAPSPAWRCSDQRRARRLQRRRPRPHPPDVRNDDMHRWIGGEATSSVGMRASQFQLTDNERQLRDLAYPLIEPPHSRPAWKSVFGDYQPLPSPWRQEGCSTAPPMAALLIDEPHRSHSSRYAQLIEDVRDDITRFEPFFASAVRVLDLDRKRDASLKPSRNCRRANAPTRSPACRRTR